MQNPVRQTERWEISRIHISREVRQRKELKKLPEMEDSLRRSGLINPIVVRANGTLVAGERRLTAAKNIGWTEIDVRVLEKMPPLEADLIELQENIKRDDLPWQDEVAAIGKYHANKLKYSPVGWTILGTANDIGMTESATEGRLALNDAIRSDETLAQSILACTSYTAARSLLVQTRNRQRMAAESRVVAQLRDTPLDEDEDDDTSGDLLADQSFDHLSPLEQEIMRQVLADDAKDAQSKEQRIITAGKKAMASLPVREELTPAEIITQGDMLEWLPGYTGQRFDFLHCDFPYGINYSGNRGRATGKSLFAPTYTDTPDLYWELVECLLANKDRLLFQAAHVMFWFDMRYYADTITAFQKAGFKLVTEWPLIWNKVHEGIASDSKRRPRHVYEAALIFSLGDRQTVKLVSDVATASSGRGDKVHISEKPIPVLQQFLSAFIDRHTAVCDPTCGSGNALAVAHALGAVALRGYDISQENVDVARSRLGSVMKGVPTLPPSAPLANIEDEF